MDRSAEIQAGVSAGMSVKDATDLVELRAKVAAAEQAASATPTPTPTPTPATYPNGRPRLPAWDNLPGTALPQDGGKAALAARENLPQGFGWKGTSKK